MAFQANPVPGGLLLDYLQGTTTALLQVWRLKPGTYKNWNIPLLLSIEAGHMWHISGGWEMELF